MRIKSCCACRSADKLAAVKEELSGSCAEVETMAIDATDFNDEVCVASGQRPSKQRPPAAGSSCSAG